MGDAPLGREGPGWQGAVSAEGDCCAGPRARPHIHAQAVGHPTRLGNHEHPLGQTAAIAVLKRIELGDPQAKPAGQLRLAETLQEPGFADPATQKQKRIVRGFRAVHRSGWLV